MGPAIGPVRDVGHGAYEQRFRFGSILKPLHGTPRYATRYVVTIQIAAIKCFGTDDPSGTDQLYLVAAVYGLDPLKGPDSVQTKEIHFGDVREKAVFGQGRELAGPIFIPGDGEIRVILSLWDEELSVSLVHRIRS